MLLNIIAIVLSALALVSTTYLALHQMVLQRQASYLPAYAELFSELRSVSFHDHYQFVTETLPAECDPQLGISGLPQQAREAIYDIVGLFYPFAVLRLVGIIDERVLALLQWRIIPIWEAIAPFVERERELRNNRMMTALEAFANDARGIPTDSLHKFLQVKRRRRWLHYRFRERSLANDLGLDPALDQLRGTTVGS